MLLCLFAVLLLTVAMAALSVYVSVSNRATVKTVGVKVYFDQGCSQEVSMIDWGVISEMKNYTVYVKNIGSAPVTLSMETESWNPANVTKYVLFTWDYSGGVLNAGEVKAVTFTFQVVDLSGLISEQITNVSWTIVITGTET